jgi:hypothetical protein
MFEERSKLYQWKCFGRKGHPYGEIINGSEAKNMLTKDHISFFMKYEEHYQFWFMAKDNSGIRILAQRI